jgi:periplasmic divalent cation tolerance protein
MGKEEICVRVALVTAPSIEVGKRLARELVEARLAACVNVLPGVTSVYEWKGEICEDGEALLVIKTTASAIFDLERAVLAKHTYETPEFVVLDAKHVEASYANWLFGQVD